MELFSKFIPRFKSKDKSDDDVYSNHLRRPTVMWQKSEEAKWELSSESFYRESEVDEIENFSDGSRKCQLSPVDSTARDWEDIEPSSTASGSEQSQRMFVRSLDGWNPETCIRLLRMPSVQNYSGLRKLIAESSKEWMVEFLEMRGLEVLFESVDRLSSRKGRQGKMEHTLLMLQCVSCLKAVASSKHALDFIASRRSYAHKLAEVMCTQNPLVKKQLFELMATLCVFAEDGHHLTLDILESYRASQKKRCRFSVLLDEIKRAEVLPYVGTILALINYIILGACGFRIRTRIRNEFLALGLSELMSSLQQLPDDEIALQCSVFTKSEEADEEHARSLGLKPSYSHFALFQSVLDKVEDTPHSASFLMVLKNLNLLDPADSKSDYVWSFLEEVTERAVTYPATVLRNWMLSESNQRKVRSQFTQTPVRPSDYYSAVPLENSDRSRVRQTRHRRRDDDEGSITSYGSRDSGVPVSRTQSWTSNDSPGSPSPPLTNGFVHQIPHTVEVLAHSEAPKQEKAGELKQQDLTVKKANNGYFKTFGQSLTLTRSNSHKIETNVTNVAQGTTSSVPASSVLPEDEREVSLSLKSDTPIPESSPSTTDGTKSRKSLSLNFNLPFFHRSKKYSVRNPIPQVCVHPPSPDLKREKTSVRDGMTSIDLKRSRKKAQLTLALQEESSSLSDFELSLTCDAIKDAKLDECDKLLNKKSSPSIPPCESTPSTPSKEELPNTGQQNDVVIKPLSVPPPPPPPPPPPGFNPSQVQLRSKNNSCLAVPSRKINRSSWSSPLKDTEFPDADSRPIYHTLPRPKSKMKTLNWAKIPTSRVHAQSLWSEINQECSSLEVDFEKVERLFCQKKSLPSPGKEEGRLRAKLVSQVSLVDSRRSLSIGIFLKQFKGGVDELSSLVTQCKHKDIGAEKLRTLLTLLPDDDEVKRLKSYKGDPNQLGAAEHFILRLGEIENCNILVEGMLLLEEYPTVIETLREQVQVLFDACKELLTNEGLKNFMKLVLVIGNFMNRDSYAGNAVGFRLSTLPKLLETRANHPRVTLLHYLVEEAIKKDEDSLNFTTTLLQHLSRCSRLTLDGVRSELSHICKGLNRLDEAIEQGDGQLKKRFGTFVRTAKRHQISLEKKVSEIEKLSDRLASHFCEDETKFKLEECLSIFYTFCVRIKMANAENQELKMVEQKQIEDEKKNVENCEVESSK